MTRNVKIAVAQLPAWTEGTDDSERKRFRVEALTQWLKRAGEEGADLVCFGETCTGDMLPEDPYTGATTRMVQELAARHGTHVILPILATIDDALLDTALVIDNQGRIVGRFDKVHPTRAEMGYGVVPGTDFPVFDLGFGRVGVCICHDISFPESTRVLGLRGAEIIVWPHWWSGWGEELDLAVIRSRAIDNGVWLVQASFGAAPGSSWRPGMTMGRSGVIAPDGQILSNAGRYVGLAVVSVDLDMTRIAHDFSSLGDQDFRATALADRRPEAYGPITDPDLVPRATLGASLNSSPRSRSPVA